MTRIVEQDVLFSLENRLRAVHLGAFMSETLLLANLGRNDATAWNPLASIRFVQGWPLIRMNPENSGHGPRSGLIVAAPRTEATPKLHPVSTTLINANSINGSTSAWSMKFQYYPDLPTFSHNRQT
jgi:hypothetical protein